MFTKWLIDFLLVRKLFDVLVISYWLKEESLFYIENLNNII